MTKKTTAADLAEILVAVRHVEQSMLHLQAKWERYEEKTGDGTLEGEGDLGKYPFARDFGHECYSVSVWVEALELRHDRLRLEEFENAKVAK